MNALVISEELFSVFRTEVAETLEQLETHLESLRDSTLASPSVEINAAFRHAHSLKGAARMVGHDTIVTITHAMEDVLSTQRALGTRPSQALLNTMLEALTVIQRAVDGENQERPAEILLARLTTVEEAAPVPSPENAAAKAAVSQYDSERDIEQWRPIEKPPIEPEDDCSEAPASVDLVASDKDATPNAATSATSAIGKTSSVRVDTARLDRLMGYTGELVISHSLQAARNERYTEFAEEFRMFLRDLPRDLQGRGGLIAKRIDDLVLEDKKELRAFSYLTNEIDSAMKHVRMVPLAAVVPQWRRIIREAAQEIGKPVSLEADVGSIELDKHVLDALRDPIMHLLRNSVAHGIESVSERVAAGKPETGRVSVNARMRGAKMELAISDDGRGLDPKLIGAKAVEKGLTTSGELAQLTREDVLEFLFQPGFSTADSVSHLSGRGVGMDVVRKQVQELGGEATITVGSSLGGAGFQTVVPLSLASNRGFLVKIGDTTAVIGVNDVERMLRVGRDDVRQAGGETLVSLEDGQFVVLRQLSTVFGMVQEDSDEWIVAIVSSGRSRVGLGITKILGEAQYVTKRLPWNLRHVEGVQGAVILADGTLALVLDVSHLVNMRAQLPSVSRKEVLVDTGPPRVLVVDDSVTSRTLERNIVQSAGYEVTTANDGEEGWEALQAHHYDLVISDVEMPRCTGLELTSRVRASEKLRETPIVLVTSLGSEEDLAAGARVGADEYIVKRQFDQKQLLEVVARLV